MIAIIDYGVGNLFSLQSSLRAIGEEVVVTADQDVIRQADHVILPGVGAFGDAVQKLRDCGLFDFVKAQAATGKPFLGICLGMQLLFDRSLEYGEHEGLGLIPGEVRPIEGVIPSHLDIPHMGWNALHFVDHPATAGASEEKQTSSTDPASSDEFIDDAQISASASGRCPLFRELTEGDCVYFVHSYAAFDCDANLTATAEYGVPLTAAVQKGNVYGTQFHPEKSGAVGLKILKAFAAL